MNYSKNDVFRFVEVNDANGSTKDLSTYKTAAVFMRMHPDCQLSLATLRLYVMRFRNGENYTHIPTFDADSIVKDIKKNSETAKEAFGAAVRGDTFEVDLNPLGVFKEEPIDINKLFFDIPETYAKYVGPLKLDSIGKKLGVISDCHLPIHDRQSMLASHAHLKKLEIDSLILLGDIMDLSNLTRHAHRRSLGYTWREEVEVTKAYIKSLRVLFPNIPIIYAEGNHESWFSQYVIRQASQLDGEYRLPERLELEKYNIQWVDETRLMTYGKLYLHHGHRFGVGGGRNVATRLLDKLGVNFLCGHYHKEMYDEKRSLNEQTHGVWINSCLADQHPDYNPHNSSTHGFSTIELLNDAGDFNVKQYKIINGRVIG